MSNFPRKPSLDMFGEINRRGDFYDCMIIDEAQERELRNRAQPRGDHTEHRRGFGYPPACGSRRKPLTMGEVLSV